MNDKHLALEDIPIVTYCAHSKCDASHKLAIILLKAGFVNLLYFKGGMEEYANKKLKIK